MELKDGGDPPTADWLEHRVQAKDGGVLSPHGLSIDMTYFEAGGKSYIAWSQGDKERKGAKANVSIAEVNSDKPCRPSPSRSVPCAAMGLGAGRRE